MGRVRGKGKKQKVISLQEDLGSGEEEKVPAYKRRGRPIKPLKDGNEETEEELMEGGMDGKDSISNNDKKSKAATKNGRKRKMPGLTEGKTESAKEENGVVAKLSIDKVTISIGFRQSGSRRKNKPRRAAEAMVECI